MSDLASRTVSLPVAAVVAFCMLASGGGVGSAITDRSTASEVRELRTEMRGEFKLIREHRGRTWDRIEDHEDRIRKLERPQ